ncbi:MAG: hypothetical protein V3T72_05865 [Thermoanaerobaculia bacterium]
MGTPGSGWGSRVPGGDAGSGWALAVGAARRTPRLSAVREPRPRPEHAARRRAGYGDAGDLDRGLPHYRESIQFEEQQGNLCGASQTRFNVALGLAGAGRLQDALAYAEAALRGFESLGGSAAEDVQGTRGLIEQIRKNLGK